MLRSHGVLPLGGVKQWRVEKQAIFELNASISRKRLEIHPKLLLMTNRKSYGLSIDTKVDDLG